MKIHQLFTDSSLRNFTYIIELNNKTALVIDPWCDIQVDKFLIKHGLSLTTIINTHEHRDHTQGNQKLVDTHDCEVWAHQFGQGKIPSLSRHLIAEEKIQLEESTSLEVIDTPGHSHAHLCFIIYDNNKAIALFTGDILFNAGVGNCHNGGNVNDLYETISHKIAKLNNDIKIYPGHEYLKTNLEFTLSLEPNNQHAQKWLSRYQQIDFHSNPITTTLADEKEINTFLRLNNAEIKSHLQRPCTNEKQVFTCLRSLRDKW